MDIWMSDDVESLLLRNVHPHFYDNGRVGSSAFIPSAEHDYRLSVDYNKLSTAQESLERHTNVFGLQSGGVFGITTNEFDECNVDVVPDPIPLNQAHALADYTKVKSASTAQLKRTGRKLAGIATKRGKLA